MLLDLFIGFEHHVQNGGIIIQSQLNEWIIKENADSSCKSARILRWSR
jgi:hypothetical protein